MTKTKPPLDPQELLERLRAYRAGSEHRETINTTSAAMGVSRATLLRWLNGTAAPRAQSQIDQLERFLARNKA